VDDGHFDSLTRRVSRLALPPLPRRGVTRLLGATALSSVLGPLVDWDVVAKKQTQKGKGNGGAKNQSKDGAAKNQSNGATAEKKKCKKSGSKCDKKKCKKKGKKCCCNNVKCKNSVCGTKCPTNVDFNDEFGGNGSGAGDFNSPWGIAIDQDGFLYVTDTGNERVQIFNENGNFEDQFGSQGNGQEQFQTPLGIGITEDGSLRIIVADPGETNSDRRLRRFDDNGDFIEDIGRSQLGTPTGVAIDNDNNIWVVNNVNDGEVFLFEENGDFITSFNPSGSGDLNNPQGIAVFEDTNENATFVYIADTGNNRVVKFEYTSNGSNGLQFVDDAGSTGSGSSNFNQPIGLAVDKCGNLWVADRLNNRIQQLDKNLNFEQRFGTSDLDRPTGVAINPDDNTLYVVNNDSNQVTIYDLS
jgi:DNA-binding beta-propeller fold protein YncE